MQFPITPFGGHYDNEETESPTFGLLPVMRFKKLWYSQQPMKDLLLSLGFVAMMSPICAGQSNTKAKIVVSCTTADQLGQALCSRVKNAIAQSPKFIEVPDTEENEEQYVNISIVTVEAARSTDGRQSEVAVSIAFVMKGMLLQHNVQACDSFHIAGCAGDIIGYLDSGSVGKATNKSRGLSSPQTTP